MQLKASDWEVVQFYWRNAFSLGITGSEKKVCKKAYRKFVIGIDSVEKKVCKKAFWNFTIERKSASGEGRKEVTEEVKNRKLQLKIH